MGRGRPYGSPDRGRSRGQWRGGSMGRGTGRPMNEKEREISKPWVNHYLRTEIFNKYRLKAEAAKTKSKSAVDAYLAQRKKVDNFEEYSKRDFFRRFPDQESYWLPILASEAAREATKVVTCDVCDQFFNSQSELEQHEALHETCGLDGCNFTAHPTVLEVHILHLHSTGLYKKIAQGYSKVEVEKWRNDRKKNFPTLQRSLAAQATLAAKRVRKERLAVKRAEKRKEMEEKNKDRPGAKQRKRTRKKHKGDELDTQDKSLLPPFEFPEFDAEDYPPDPNIPRFMGTRLFLESIETSSHQEQLSSVNDTFDISDEEWDDGGDNNSISDQSDQVEQLNESTSPTNETGDGDVIVKENISTDKVSATKIVDNSEASDNDAPDEEPIVKRVEKDLEIISTQTETFSAKRKRNNQKDVKPVKKKNILATLKRPKRPPTLLERLLNQDIDKERSNLLQCLRYVCQNDFFLNESKE